MKKRALHLSLLFFLSLGMALSTAPNAPAQVVQTPLAAGKIPQFAQPLPLLDVQGGAVKGTIETLFGNTALSISMFEFNAKVLPPGTFAAGVQPLTRVWGYVGGATAPAVPKDTYLGPVIVNTRAYPTPTSGKLPTTIKWINSLGNTATSQLLAYTQSTDQTLMWADPSNNEANDCYKSIAAGLPPTPNCAQNYVGPIPAVPHLHGGEVPPELDGGPDAWFTSDGLNKGHGYHTLAGAAANEAIYAYPNTQEAANIWFHDHTLGATRLNVYAGLAGGYIITESDPAKVPPADLNSAATIIPLIIQDRMFDTTGQLFFPNIGLNPEHPFWVPEFVGDVILVNGKAWPFLEVAPNQRYRFLVLNGSNARTYALDFKVQGQGKSPTFWVIGTDGGYLDTPQPVQQLVVMPGERYDVIVDFTGFKAGTTLLLQNSARTPFPAGAPVNRSTTGRVMEIRVLAAPTAGLPVTPPVTFNPAVVPAPNLRPANPIQKLANFAAGTQAVAPQVKRQLTLNEVMGPGGPLEILVNNTTYEGIKGTARTDFTALSHGGNTTYYSELPQEGATELWEVINLTADAHPIHLHLVQFQVMNRQNFDLRRYTTAYNAAFPGLVYRPGYGPPANYNVANADGAVGGNPGINGFLMGAAQPPLLQEWGWKDTVVMYPGQVTRIMVRWAPTDLATNAAPAALYFPFNPDGQSNADPGHGYVWHCHIIDHEDNEMMRPTAVPFNPAALPASRPLIKGTDY